MTAAQPAASQQRYTAVAIALHWTIAIGILFMLALGWIMDDFVRGGPGSPKIELIQIHKSIGITILLLSVARLIWRLMNPPPPDPPMPPWQKLLANTVHVLLYVLIIAMPLTGWIMASAGISQHETRFFGTVEMYVPGIPGLPDETRKPLGEGFQTVHHLLAWVIVAMLALHVAGAVKHQFVDKDGLLARMAPGLFGRTAGPMDNGHGALWAFGAAVVLFAAAAGTSMMGAAVAPVTAVASEPAAGAPPAATTPGAPATVTASNPEPAPPAQASPAPTWKADAAQSSIKFKAAYMGRPFEGSFKKWDAEIQFDPAKPQDARIRVTIPTSSISTGQAYFDENVTQGDWFDVAKHPTATFEVNEGVFKDSETQYEATGVLTVKGVKYPLRLPFTLNITGANARMHAEVKLRRLAIGLGKDTKDKANGDEEWVQNEVAVVVDVVATRQ